MANKKQSLIQRAKETVRQPKPRQALEAEQYKAKKGYKIVAVSLYAPEALWIDQTTKLIQKGGNPKASRSYVVREAILRLQEAFANMTPQEINEDIANHQRKRSAHE